MTERDHAVAPPADSLELSSLRDGGRREIPWEQPLDADLDARRRAAIGAGWRHLMQQEHLAVGAFAAVAIELADVGCDSVVLALIARASADEVRHADLCRRMVARYLGPDAAPRRLSGIPRIPRHDTLSPRERALLHVTEMCCLNETVTGVYLTAAHAGATEPVARAVIESLLEDEIDHGRVGWAHLASACSENKGAAALISEQLPQILDRTVGKMFGATPHAPAAGDPILAAHGQPTGATLAGVYVEALRDVILPGFGAVGVDVAAARAHARSKAWLPQSE